MSKFRGTIVFALIVGAVGGFAIYELQKSKVEEETKAEKGYLFPDLKAEQVTGIEVHGTGKVKMQKGPEGWALTEPLAADGDPEAIQGFLDSLLTTSVEALDTEGAAVVLEKYGLNAPETEIFLKDAAGKEFKIAVGQVRTYDKGFYVQKNGDEKVYVVDTSWESTLQKRPDDFRNKKIRFGESNLTRVQIQSKTSAAKDKFELVLKDGLWMAPQHPKYKIDSAAVNEYFAKAKELKAEGILPAVSGAKTGLARPNIDLTFEFADQKKVQVQFEIGKERDAKMWNSTATGDPIYRLPSAKAEEFAKTLDDFRDKTVPFAFTPTQAQRVEILKNKGKEKLSFEKQGESWVNLVKPDDKVNAGELTSLLTGLSALKASEFAAAAKSPPKENEITVRNAEGAPVFTLSFGGLQKDAKGIEVYLAKTNLTDEPVRVAKSAVDELWNKNLIEAVKADAKEATQK